MQYLSHIMKGDNCLDNSGHILQKVENGAMYVAFCDRNVNIDDIMGLNKAGADIRVVRTR